MIPSSNRIEAENPPTGRFVTSEGLRIHYVALGPDDPDAPTAILIHGATGNLNDMTFDLGPRLAAQGVRVICFDRPGLGHSERAPVEGWLPSTQARVLEGASQALGLRRAVLIGHSWGGAVALAWAIATPARALGAVIFAGIAYTVYDSAKLSQMLKLATNIVRMPKWYFQWALSIMALITAFGMGLRAVELVLTGRAGRAEREIGK